VALSSGVDAELTATPRCGVQRYTAVTDGTMSVLADLGFAINWDRPVDCRLAWDGRALTGRRISSGWAEKQYLFFSSKFSKEPESVTMIERRSGATGTGGRRPQYSLHP
jgi:putative alpha-1,2-mannosidase